MKPSTPVDREFDLRPFLAAVVRRRRFVALVTALCIAAAGVFSLLVTPVYESEVVIQLSPHSDPTYAFPHTAIRTVASPDLLGAVVQGGRDLSNVVKAAPVRETPMMKMAPPMIRVVVRAGNPERARHLAAGVADQFIARASDRVVQRRKIITGRLAGLTEQVRNVGEQVRLSQETLARLQQAPAVRRDAATISIALHTATVAESLQESLLNTQTNLERELLVLTLPGVVEPATLPHAPVYPRLLANMVLASLLGFVAAGIAAYLGESFWSTAPSVERLSGHLGSPSVPPRETHVTD